MATGIQTLDNLPAHLLTPFNGPVPPSNLLDKIAKGVSKAKGPIDWPHSMRATRAKIVELARVRANESGDGGDSTDTIAEEETTGSDVPLQQTTNTGPKRPLYRQSSMDFMQTAKVDIKDNDYIRRYVSDAFAYLMGDLNLTKWYTQPLPSSSTYRSYTRKPLPSLR